MSKKKRTEEDPVKRFDLVLPVAVDAQIVRWNVKEGGDVFEGQELCSYLPEGTRDVQFLRSPFPFEGVIRHLLPEKTLLHAGAAVAVVEYCAHEMVFADLCAICGKAITVSHSSDKQATISLIPSQPALTVSRAVAERDAERTAERLVSANKLSLVLDLDQTLDPEVESLFGPAAETKGDITCAQPTPAAAAGGGEPEAEDSPAAHLYRFTLEGNPSKFYLKLRPHLQEFLMGVKDLFELHIYTMGSRSYARKVAQIIDPQQKLFRENIVSRDECGSMNLKNLQRIFPVDDSMVMIIDDRVDVWQTSKNLVKIEPYFFFNDAKVNALPRDKVDGPHPHRHPVRLRRSSTGLSNLEVGLPIGFSASASTASLSTKRKRDGDDESGSSPLPPVHAAPEGLSDDAMAPMVTDLPLESGRVMLTSTKNEAPVDAASDAAATVETAEATVAGPSGDQKVRQPPKRRKIDISGMPTFKKKRKDADDQTESVDTTKETPEKKEDENEKEEKAIEKEKEEEKAKEKKSDEEGDRPADASAVPSFETPATPSSSLSSPVSSPSTAPAPLPYREVALRDGHLLHVLRTLREAHRLFYAPEPQLQDKEKEKEKDEERMEMEEKEKEEKKLIEWGGKKRDIKYCLHVQRGLVLAGVHACFSSVFPTAVDPESTNLWRLAEEFGARCYTTLAPEVTHLVALKEGTEKVRAAQARGDIRVVHLEWLLESIRTWRRPEEARYRHIPEGVPEGLRPYEDHIRWLEMCYVRDLDKVLLAFHGPKEAEEEEEEVSDADQDEFLKWALKEGEEGEEEEEDEEEEDEEDEEEDKKKKNKNKKGRPIKTATPAKDEGEKDDDEEKEEEEEAGEWDELERQLEEGGEEGREVDYSTVTDEGGDEEREEKGAASKMDDDDDEEDRFDRLAALERLEEEDVGRGRRGKFGNMFNKKVASKKVKGRPAKEEEEDDYDDLINEIEDELFGDEDEDEAGGSDRDE